MFTTRLATAYVRIPTQLRTIAVCRFHFELLCTRCLRTSAANELGDTMCLRRPVVGDVDEVGQTRKHSGLICSFCRETAFTSTLRRDLMACARQGSLLGLNNNWQQTVAYKDHVFFGVGRSDMMARQAIEDLFLMQHTSYGALAEGAAHIQEILRKWKIWVYDNRGYLPASQADLTMLRNLLWTVFEDDDTAFELNILYRRWTNEIQTGAYDDLDHRLDVEKLRRGCGGLGLWPFIRDKLVHRSIDMWVQDRFLQGYWVMPSDEIEQMLHSERSIHTPLLEIARNSERPTDLARPAIGLYTSGIGRFRFDFQRAQRAGEYFLPPDRLLQVMNMRFTDVITNRLENAFTEVVTYFTRQGYKHFDAIERQFASMTSERLLQQLEQPTAWFESTVDETGEAWRPKVVSAAASDPGGGSVVSEDDEGLEEMDGDDVDGIPGDEGDNEDDDEDDEKRSDEPRIEIVPTNDLQPAYDIRDGWSTTPDDERDESDVSKDDDLTSEPSAMESIADSAPLSPNLLGKRKASDDSDGTADEDRPPRIRHGSGQTSHSGDSNSTALVTPDDSPSLLAEESILVAEEDDTATDTTPVAPLAMGEMAASPAASPTLGKRKSPEDDDLIQPPRRPGSLTTPPLVAANDSDNGSNDDMDEVKADVADEDDKVSTVATSTEEEGTPLAALSERSDNAEPAKPAVLKAATTVPRDGEGVSAPYMSELSDSESEGSLDTEQLDDTPFVPPSWARLGPCVDEILENTWYRAREPLRRCQCAICQRAEKAQSENLRRFFMASVEDLVSPGGLHIA